MQASVRLLLATLVIALPVSAQMPTSDYPGSVDWPVAPRPANSIIVAASHTDSDEFKVPLGPYNSNVQDHFQKTVTATGAVDKVAFSGPPSTSTFAAFNRTRDQLVAAHYTAVYTCIGKGCGGYQFVMELAQPLIDATASPYSNLTIDTMAAVTEDVRYGVFQRGNEYLMVVAALAPGKYSGLLLIDVGGHMPAARPPAPAQ
ncbi:DUF4892 domain-containing protein [Terriglobus aquaticus]|uniref:DUF4892 domain-containing protein n=1 Tax=Terriglobus aquaticus TaxID=940139 RepID=A0ABW9KJA5_9BACT|nr:DUF4892 domain-containing protein [Terriglobus aquaticus]